MVDFKWFVEFMVDPSQIVFYMFWSCILLCFTIVFFFNSFWTYLHLKYQYLILNLFLHKREV